MFSYDTVLQLLKGAGPVVAALPAFKEIFNQIVGTFNQTDQDVLRGEYDKLVAENDAGHDRLQGKLDEASRQ